MRPALAVRLYRRALRIALGDGNSFEKESVVQVFSELHAHAVARGGWWGGLKVLLAEVPGLIRLGYQSRMEARGVSRSIQPAGEGAFMLRDVTGDLRYAVRFLRRSPGFTAIIVLTLALGVGANTAIFSLVYGVLLKPLAYPSPERLVVLGEGRTTGTPGALSSTSPGSFLDWQSAARSVSGMAAYATRSVILTGFGEPEMVQGATTLGGLLDVLGVAPLFGRTIQPADEDAAAPRVVVLSHGLWQRLYGEERDVLGRTILLGVEPAAVIGVMPAGFRFPDAGTEFWEPARYDAAFRINRDQYFLQVVARLRSGTTVEQLSTEMAAIADRLRRDWSQYNTGLVINVAPLAVTMVADVRGRLLVLMGAVALLLLITCTNIANLMLARAATRRQEMAIRRALGAGRLRQARQLLTESLLLAFTGGAAAIVVARFLTRALVESQRSSLPRVDDVSLDTTVLAFAFAVAATAGVAFGLVPAIQLSRGRSAEVLRQGGRGSPSHMTGRRLLVVAELALALMLLTGAGLLLRSFTQLTRVETGLETSGLITAQLPMQGARVQFVTDAIERLRAIPGVRDAAVASQIPLTGRGIGAWFNMYSRPVPEGTTPPAVPYRVISPGYFATARIPLLAGRSIEETDGREGTHAVVVNEALAKRFFPSGDAIGQEIYLGAPDNRLFDRATIVGIVGDTRDAGPGADPLPTVFAPHRLMPYWGSFFYLVRADGAVSPTMAAVRRELRALAPDVPLRNLRTMDEIAHDSVAPARTSLTLLGAFAAVALAMAALGVFGVLSYVVAQRTRELGVRVALGADPAKLRMLVVRQALALAIGGLSFGLLGALAFTRLLRGLLFGISNTDPTTYGAVGLLLLGVCAVASWLPARRATRVSPMTALRDP